MGRILSPALLTAGVEIAAAVVIALSFMPWVAFSYSTGDGIPTGLDIRYIPGFTMRGDEVKSLSSFGDGYLTAGLALAALTAAIAGRFTNRMAVLIPGAIAVCGFVASGLAVYVVFYDWRFEARGIGVNHEPTTELFALTILSVVIGLAGMVLLTNLDRATIVPDPELNGDAI